MFTGCMILCDGADRMSSGKFLIFGAHNRINIVGPRGTIDLAFYVRFMTTYVGQLDATLKIYNRQNGNDNPRPNLSVDVHTKLQLAQGAMPDAAHIFELALGVPQAVIAVSPEAEEAGEDVLLPFDAVFSTNGHEIARMYFSVFFQLKPQVKVTSI